MTAVAYRCLSFNETFTPACFGTRLPAGMQLAGLEGGAANLSSAGQRRPQRNERGKGEMQLVYYVGVARDTSIVVDFGKQRRVLAQVLSGVLAHVPPLVSRYSMGYGRTCVLFLRSEGYTYFSVGDESLGREHGFQVLSQIQEAFLECMARHTTITPRSASSSARHATAGATWHQLCTSSSASSAPTPAVPESTEGVPSPCTAPAANNSRRSEEGNERGATEGPHGTEGTSTEAQGAPGVCQGSLEGAGPLEGEGRDGDSGGLGGAPEVHSEQPPLRRTRSASHATAFMSEAMEARLEEIVSQCKGRLLPRPRLEMYPDAPGAYLTASSSARGTCPGEPGTSDHLPPLVHHDEGFGPPAIGRGYKSQSTGSNDSVIGNTVANNKGSESSGGKVMSARESLLSEIADMLKEVDLPRTPRMPAAHRAALGPRGVGIPKAWWRGESGEEAGEEEEEEEDEWEEEEDEEDEEEEEEHIPGMHLFRGGIPDHHFLPVGVSEAWAPPRRRNTTGVPAVTMRTSAITMSTPTLHLESTGVTSGVPEAPTGAKFGQRLGLFGLEALRGGARNKGQARGARERTGREGREGGEGSEGRKEWEGKREGEGRRVLPSKGGSFNSSVFGAKAKKLANVRGSLSAVFRKDGPLS